MYKAYSPNLAQLYHCVLAHWDCNDFDVRFVVLGVDRLMETCSTPSILFDLLMYVESIAHVMVVASTLVHHRPCRRVNHLPFVDDEA